MFQIEHNPHSTTIQMLPIQLTLLIMGLSLQLQVHQTKLNNASIAKNGNQQTQLNFIRGTALTTTKRMKRSNTNTMQLLSFHQGKVPFFIL